MVVGGEIVPVLVGLAAIQILTAHDRQALLIPSIDGPAHGQQCRDTDSGSRTHRFTGCPMDCGRDEA